MSEEHGQMSYTHGVAGAVVVPDCTMYELLLLELPPHDRLTESEETTIYKIDTLLKVRLNSSAKSQFLLVLGKSHIYDTYF